MKNPFIQIQSQDIGHSQVQSEEIQYILHEDVLQLNISVSGCFQLMHHVNAKDSHIRYAQDVCKLKTIMQKLIPWHCPSITRLSTIYIAYNKVYDIDVIQKICLHADKGYSLLCSSLRFHILPVVCIIVLLE